VTDTLLVACSAGGQTSKAIFSSTGEPLSQLGEKWMGSPFTTLASLIPVPAVAEVMVMTLKETIDHMMYHFTDVSAPMLRSRWVTYLSKGLSPFLFRRVS
jgi:hypothetical protein